MHAVLENTVVQKYSCIILRVHVCASDTRARTLEE